MAVLALASGCTPRTGDALVDRVAAMVAPFSPCLLVGQTRVFRMDDEPGPPALLVADSIRSAEARRAAAEVAVPWQTAKQVEPTLHGSGSVDTCAARVDRPVYSGRFAFVGYAEPGGGIGTYVFRREPGGWRYVESIRLGFW